MPVIHHVGKTQRRYVMVPVLDADGQPVRQVLNRADKHGNAVSVAVTVPDKDQPLPLRICDACGTPIEIGTAHKWIAPRSGMRGNGKRFRHEGCPSWLPWETSDSLSARLAQVEHDFGQRLADAVTEDEVTDALADAAEQVREIAEARRESAQNIEDGFQHATAQSEELSEQADALDEWAGEIENADVAPPPEPEETDCDECEGSGSVEQADSKAAPCENCQGSGTYTPDEPDEDAMNMWRSDLANDLALVGEPPV